MTSHTVSIKTKPWCKKEKKFILLIRKYISKENEGWKIDRFNNAYTLIKSTKSFNLQIGLT